MCPPQYLENICSAATRRDFLKKGLTAAALTICNLKPGTSAAATSSALPTSVSFSKVIDLTHTLFEGFPTFDGSKWFTIEPMLRYSINKMNINRWSLVEHTGTHMDAPLHFSADGPSADELAVSDLVVPLAVIDISARAEHDPDTAVTPEDILAWEKDNGRGLPEGSCVLMNSGWYRLLASPKFTGKDPAGKYHTPGFSPEAAELLITKRNVKGIGVDTLSLDRGIESLFPTHNRWLPSGRWGIECVTNIHQLPAKGAHLVLGGPKVKGATGGPSRIIALV